MHLLHFVFQTKDICHVWELGGGLVFKDLLSVIIEKTKGKRLSVVLVLDLSKPDVVWSTMESLLKEVKTHLRNIPGIEDRNPIDVLNIEVCCFPYRYESICM
jgi:dynein light intermediate chain 2